MFIKDNPNLFWQGESYLKENKFVCGHCGTSTSSVKGMALRNGLNSTDSYRRDKNNGVYICTDCEMPTFIWNQFQYPGNRYGSEVSDLSELLGTVYDEARSAYSSGAYTGVALLCRKLLMHIAIELGAQENKRFIDYVNFLEEEKHITTRSKEWVDSIRTNGNASTHQMQIASKEEAEKMIKFSEMILKTNFEYPALMGNQKNK